MTHRVRDPDSPDPLDHFLVGDVVEWTSQSGGHATTKQGEVVWIGKPRRSFQAPAGLDLAELCKARTGHGNYTRMLDYIGTFGIVVLVTQRSKRWRIGDTEYASTRIYSPRPGHLTIVETP